MKNIILVFSCILLLASCSQKQFTFRKKINVDNAKVVVLKPVQNDVASASNSAKLSNDELVETYQQPLNFVQQTNILSTPIMYVLPDDSIKKKNSFGEDKSTSDSLKNDHSTNSNKAEKNTSGNFELIDLGFGLGAIMQWPIVIRDLILSKLGLKSKKRNESAYAKIKAVFLIILLSIILIFVFLVIIKAVGYI